MMSEIITNFLAAVSTIERQGIMPVPTADGDTLDILWQPISAPTPGVLLRKHYDCDIAELPSSVEIYLTEDMQRITERFVKGIASSRRVFLQASVPPRLVARFDALSGELTIGKDFSPAEAQEILLAIQRQDFSAVAHYQSEAGLAHAAP